MKKAAGFSLVELVVTLAVVSIAIYMAAPNMVGFVQGNKLTANTNALVTAMRYARMEAVKRNASVEIVSTNADGNWAAGWVVQLVSDGTDLRAFPEMRGNVSVTGAATKYTFSASGGVLEAPDTIEVCAGRTGETGRALGIMPTGRVSVTTMTCN